MLILLYKGVSPISRLIRFRASRVMWLGPMSDRSHASIVASDGYRTHVDMGTMPAYLATCPMYEAWHRRVATVPGGVRRRVGIGAAHTLHTRVDIYELDDAFVDVDAVRRFLAAQVGLAYDMRGVMGFVSRRDGAQRRDRWFCSELVAQACIEGGVELLARMPPHRTHPGMLALSPRLSYLGYAITSQYPIFVPYFKEAA